MGTSSVLYQYEVFLRIYCTHGLHIAVIKFLLCHRGFFSCGTNSLLKLSVGFGEIPNTPNRTCLTGFGCALRYAANSPAGSDDSDFFILPSQIDFQWGILPVSQCRAECQNTA